MSRKKRDADYVDLKRRLSDLEKQLRSSPRPGKSRSKAVRDWLGVVGGVLGGLAAIGVKLPTPPPPPPVVIQQLHQREPVVSEKLYEKPLAKPPSFDGLLQGLSESPLKRTAFKYIVQSAPATQVWAKWQVDPSRAADLILNPNETDEMRSYAALAAAAMQFKHIAPTLQSVAARKEGTVAKAADVALQILADEPADENQESQAAGQN